MNETNQRKKMILSKYRVETRYVGQLHAVEHTHTCGRIKQVRIFITTTSGETLKKSWARFKCFRNGRNCSFNENYVGAVTVDGSERDGRSLGDSEANEVKIRRMSLNARKILLDLKKKGRKRRRAEKDATISRKKIYFSVEFCCNAETRLLKFYRTTLLSLSIKLQARRDN